MVVGTSHSYHRFLGAHSKGSSLKNCTRSFVFVKLATVGVTNFAVKALQRQWAIEMAEVNRVQAPRCLESKWLRRMINMKIR